MSVTALFNFPDAVAEVRPRLFALEDEVVQAYWPFINNIQSSAGPLLPPHHARLDAGGGVGSVPANE